MSEVVEVEVIGCCKPSEGQTRATWGIFRLVGNKENQYGTFDLQSIYEKKEFHNISLLSSEKSKPVLDFFRNKYELGVSTFALVNSKNEPQKIKDENGQTYSCNWVAQLFSMERLPEDVLQEACALKAKNLVKRSLSKLLQGSEECEVLVDEVDCNIAKIFAQFLTLEILKFESKEDLENNFCEKDLANDKEEEGMIADSVQALTSYDEHDAIHRRLLSDEQRSDIHTTFVNPNRPENRAAMAKPWFGPLTSSNSSIGFDFWKNKSFSDLTERSRSLSLSNWREVFGLMKFGSEQKLLGPEVDQPSEPLSSNQTFTVLPKFVRKAGKRSHSESTDTANGGAYDKSLFLSN